jgi:hypothetical protein
LEVFQLYFSSEVGGGQLFLGTPKEVISTAVVSELWIGKHGGLQRLIHDSLNEAEVRNWLFIL